MTESAFTSKLLRELKVHPAMREALIWKVSDRFAAGRPDIQVILNGVTTYFEIKVAPYKTTKLQDWTIQKIGFARCHVVRQEKFGGIAISNGTGVFEHCFDIQEAAGVMSVWCKV